ncbi:MAG: family 43 glycosylhydrolase [Clostridiales bacterium]|jgi:beta-galactosidase|nr:family 43 glycosylhydrolase [Clostridiales bacterium]
MKGMKRAVQCLFAAAMLVSAFAAAGAAAPPDAAWTGSEWDTNSVYAVNREDPHATFFPYANEADAKEFHNLYPEESAYYQTLNGTWKFLHAANPASRPSDVGEDSFAALGFDAGGWDDIAVPGNWQVNWNADGTLKYDEPMYVNSTVPWAKTGMNNGTVAYPSAPKNFNPVGTYRRTFEIDPSWGDRAVFLNLDGVESDCYIWINGHRVGYGEDSYTGKVFDVSPYIDYAGQNAIAVQVFRWSAGSWYENQDMMRLSGIFRDIYLTAKPKIALYDFEAIPRPAEPDQYDGDWNLGIKALLRDMGAGAAMKAGARLSATLYDAADAVVGAASFGEPAYEAKTNLLGNGYVGADVSGAIAVASPKLWSAEHPNLYKLVMTLKDGDTILETTCIRVGFREVKSVNMDGAADEKRQSARVLINGSRLLFYGVDMHESNPETGKVVDIDFIRRDYELMKTHNVNAVRMSHYPHHRLYYELANEYGLYIMDEANYETHGLTTPPAASQAVWLPGLIDRQNNMVAQGINYPSIVCWSLGNEAGGTLGTGNAGNLAMLGHIQAKDPSRLTHAQFSDGMAGLDLHSGFYGPSTSTTLSQSGGWWQNVQNSQKPSIMAEYAHAMGNSNGNMAEFIEIFDKLPRAQGAFIWEWSDHGLWTPVPGSPDEKFLGFDGDWGAVRDQRNFCMDGMVTADRVPYPQMAEVKHAYRGLTAELKDSGTYTVSNKYLFANASEYDMSWELVKNGAVAQSGKGVLDVAPAPAGVVPVAIVSPAPPHVTAPNYEGATMTSADFPVPFDVPSDAAAGDEYFFNVYFALREDTVWADAGFVVSQSQMPVSFGQPAGKKAPFAEGAVSVAEDDDSVSVSGADFSVAVSKLSGAITAYKFKGRDLLASGPVPNFWRAPTDNEYPMNSGGALAASFTAYREAAENRTTAAVEVDGSDSFVTVKVTGEFPSKGAYTATYTVYPNGEVNVAYDYALNGPPAPPANETDANARTRTRMYYMQEIGSMMTVKSDFKNLTWFGRGPGESYTDRKWGSHVGLWSGTVAEQYFQYAMTQETGNKVETRWFSMTDDDGFGIVVKGSVDPESDYLLSTKVHRNADQFVDRSIPNSPYIEFNALRYAPAELGEFRYKHPYELEPVADGDICLRVNMTSAGVGGDDSWGRIVRDQYRPMATGGALRYSYSILPVENLDVGYAMEYSKTEYGPEDRAVSYAGNGGAGEGPAASVGAPGEAFAAAANTYAAPAGKRFVEWNTKANGLGTGYKPGDEVVMPPEDMTLYAIWGYDGSLTFHNNPTSNAADPQVIYDKNSGYYYAYSTDGARSGYRFGIYRSADLATWEQLNGAIPTNDPNTWANDWFWAPECYYNENNGYYYLFYSGRMTSAANRLEHFGFSDFEEACKTGVAVSKSPEGPFYNIAKGPIDYWPYDPDYHDVNQLMASPFRDPPATKELGETAPKGVYIPFIDANVFFDDDGRIYFYYSRNAYRNWVWDDALGKYIEESNIYAVELNTDWWTADGEPTMPTVKSAYINANKAPGDASPGRMDGFVPAINYASEPQSWENAHVDDYAAYSGARKNRRWAEGSFIIKHSFDDGTGEKPIYYIVYSCNNYENQYYGEGYAVSDSPLGPWKKSSGNPLVGADPDVPIYSTGHGSVIASPDGSELYHVYHARAGTTGNRRIYANRLYIDDTLLTDGAPTLTVTQIKGDQPLPSGVGPLAIGLELGGAGSAGGGSGAGENAGPGEGPGTVLFNYSAANNKLGLNWFVANADGGRFLLSHALNRVVVSVGGEGAGEGGGDDPVAVYAAAGSTGAAGTLTFLRPGSVDVTFTYQRQKAGGAYQDAYNITGDGLELVSITRTFTAVEASEIAVAEISASGGGASAEFSVANGPAPLSALCMVAIYDANGALVALESRALELGAFEEGRLALELDAPANGASAKAFLWNAGTFVPLCAAASIGL